MLNSVEHEKSFITSGPEDIHDYEQEDPEPTSPFKNILYMYFS